MPDSTPERAKVTEGLRQLADYLDANPGVPVSEYTHCDLLAFTSHDYSDAASRAEVDRIAALLGAPVRDETGRGGHYKATRSFGPISYSMIHIPAEHRAAHAALMSYSGCVTPDSTLKAA
jgi:hypothetical protein